MSAPDQPSGNKPSPLISKLKLVRDLLVVLALVWLGFEAYWGYFKLKIWLSGFGTGAFWTAGLVCGFVYFYSVHKIHANIKTLPPGFKKTISTIGFALGLLILNPVPVSLALWLLVPPGSISTIGHWFFIGSAIAGGLVILLERLFEKKAEKGNPTH
jgi:hypothetical protein